MSIAKVAEQAASKGSRARRPGSLAGIAAARREHQGQFFTPDNLASVMWRIVEYAERQVRSRRISIMDNSIGSGRLVCRAEADRHAVYGFDVDEELTARLSEAMMESDMAGNVVTGAMEEMRAFGMDVALINPPFSLHLESPAMEPYNCTSFGRFGPNTSATSHIYALYQALDAASICAAILPASSAAEIMEHEELAARLRAIVKVPGYPFACEGTKVKVVIAVFGSEARADEPLSMSLAEFEGSDLSWLDYIAPGGTPTLRHVYHDPGKQVITIPTTGNKRVRIVKDGRNARLIFACGYAEAVVLNRVLKCDIRIKREPSMPRLPAGVRWSGEGLLDIEAWLASGDAFACLRLLASKIENAGFEPEIDASLLGYIKKAVRRHRVESAPFGRWVWSDGQATGRFTARAKKSWLADITDISAPAVMRGDTMEVFEREGRFFASDNGKDWEIPAHVFHSHFEVEGQTASGDEGEWVQVSQPLYELFPEAAAAVRARAIAAGVDKILTWSDYQFTDLVEVLMKRGAIVSWDTGLGKARLAASLILASGCKRGVIVVEAGLLAEMKAELETLPIDANEWQIIESPEQAANLRRINVVSYTRLRMPVGENKKRTYGKAMRHRVGIVVADEADILCNPNSAQSRAVAQISPKRRYALSATPARNYPRDLHPLTTWTAGDGTAVQPYGWRRAFITSDLYMSMDNACRGIDRFRDDFIVTEWVTNEFAEENRDGAKREVPKIADVVGYRRWLSPLVKRRVVGEPDVAKYISIPDGETEIENVGWDMDHLGYYLTVADEFARFFNDARENRRANNLAILLARINAVCLAASCPQMNPAGFEWKGGLTSKQRHAVKRLAELAGAGHKTVCYARNRKSLEIIAEQLRQRGIEAVLYHGGISRDRRTQELNRKFRYGDAPVLLASLELTQKGLNLWQADRTLFFDRSWSAKTEYQARKRIERPQQKRKPVHRFIHLPGGIDEYQEQMVEMKADAIQAGLDWGDPRLADQEFVHLDTILGRFVEDLAAMHGYRDSMRFRDAVKRAA